jgi:hypothetical protein
VTAVLPPSSRSPWPAVVLGLAVLAIAAAIAIVLITRGGDDSGQTPAAQSQPQTAPTGSGRQEQPSDAALRTSVDQLSEVVDLSAEGRAATASGDFATAEANRRQVIDRVNALSVEGELQTSRALLRGAVGASLRSNLAHQECGNCPRAQAADAEATDLKEQFVREFNPYALKYLHRTYDPSEI